MPWSYIEGEGLLERYLKTHHRPLAAVVFKGEKIDGTRIVVVSNFLEDIMKMTPFQAKIWRFKKLLLNYHLYPLKKALWR